MTNNATRKVEKLNDTLFKAIEKGDLNRVEDLLQSGADPNVAIENGYILDYTPLIHAASHGQAGIVKALLGKGANPHAKTTSESGGAGDLTALHSAVAHGEITGERLESVKLLLAAGADVNVETNGGGTPLESAVRRGWDEVIHILLNTGATTHLKPRMELSCINAAAGSGRINLLELLVKKGVQVDQQNATGDTALLIAAATGQKDAVRWLLDHGAAINHRNKDNQTALISAAIFVWYAPDYDDEQHAAGLATVRLLVERGADISVKDTKGKTALDYAKMAYCKDLYHFLRSTLGPMKGSSTGKPKR